MRMIDEKMGDMMENNEKIRKQFKRKKVNSKRTVSPSKEGGGHENIRSITAYACPKCGSYMAPGVKICLICGVPLNGEGGEVSSDEDYEEQFLPAPEEEEHETYPLAMAEEALASLKDLGDQLPAPSDYEEQEPPPPPEQETELQEELPEIEEESMAYSESIQERLLPSNYKSNEKGKQIVQALKDYTKKRRKRYLFGALSLGLSMIFFVLIWLVTVYQVLNTDSVEWFGAEVMALLICAGIFSIFGLYLIMSYPSSTLDHILVSASGSKDHY